MSEKVSLQEVANNAASRAMRNLYTCAPAKVVKWDSSNGRANCQILVKRVDKDEEDEDVVSSYPVVPGVPVHFIGAGGFRLTCPIKDGPDGSETTGLLIFSHLSLDKWLSGSGSEVEPEHNHDHALGDAIFIPGLKPFGAPWGSMPDEMSIGDDSDGNGRIHFKSGEIDLGDGATKQVARKGDKTKTLITVTMGTGPLALAIVAIIITDPTTGLPNTLLTGNLSGYAAGEIIEGSAHVKAVD